MSRNATVKAGNAFKLNAFSRQDRKVTTGENRSSDVHLYRGSIKGMLTKTRASFSIEDRIISISVEVPEDLHSELLEAFAEKLKSDFIKNLFHVATLPSNFRTPFLKKMKEKEIQWNTCRAQRIGPALYSFSEASYIHAHSLWPKTDVTNRLNSKESQLSIGLTTSSLVYQCVEQLAAARAVSINKIACELFSYGLSELSSLLNVEDDEIVFGRFENDLKEWQEPSTRRWMLRTDRKLYNRTSLLAHEFGKSLAYIALLCLARSLSEKTPSLQLSISPPES